MDRQSAWQSLAEAERLVAEGHRRLDGQREIVAQMQHNGSEFTQASALLLHMLAAQERHVRQLAKILSWLENGQA
jgi:hypothetical protein